MSNLFSTSFASFIRRLIVPTFLVFFIIICGWSMVYGFVQYYKQQRSHVQQLSKLLVNSASTVDGASLVARQINVLLDNNPALSNITFYSSDSPILAVDANDINDNNDSNETNDINNIERNNRDWYNALFADSISFNRAVTSRYLGSSHYYNAAQLAAIDNQSRNTESANTQEAEPLGAQQVLIGYINISLDIKQLRLQWLSQNYLLLLGIFLVSIASLFYLLRRLKGATKELAELAKVCQIVVSNPDIEQLPVIQQHFKLTELTAIRLALVGLFEQLKKRQQQLEELAVFEQQLYNKDLSLNVQRNNFQSMITHELKTSLNAISGGLQLLDNYYLSMEQKDTLAIIHKGSQHLEATIERIIQLNKIEKGQISINLRVFNPLQLLSELIAEFEAAAKQKDLELISRIYHIDYELEGDANKIKQILRTLIENAIKFTESGQIIIESQLTHFNKSIRWEIKVSDTGIGIDKRYLKDIFEPFFQIDPSRTRDYEGAGVGLPVISQIVQLLGASIEVTSELEVGSQFTIILPLQNAYQNNSHYSDSQYSNLQYSSLQYSKKPLSALTIIYYHNEKMGVIADRLQALGARVMAKQHEFAVLQELEASKVDIVMIAQELLPKQAAHLAKLIRAKETSYRVLIIYWYPAHQERFLENFEYLLKAAGVDYCYAATQDSKTLYHLLKKQ